MNENKRSIYDIDPNMGESQVAKVVREANALPNKKRLKALSKLANAMISNDAEKDLLEIFDYMEGSVFDADWMKEEKTVSILFSQLSGESKFSKSSKRSIRSVFGQMSPNTAGIPLIHIDAGPNLSISKPN